MRRASLIAALVLTASVAHADREASRAHYERGKRAYASGQFETAIADFERAYAAHAAPEYLNNIGQAYRRLGRCTEAVRYLERYLAAAPSAPNRAAVEGHLAELRATCPAPRAPAPAKRTTTTTTATTTTTEPPPASPPEPASPKPALISPPLPPPPPVVVAATSTTVPAVTRRATFVEPSPWRVAAGASLTLVDAGPVAMPPLAQIRAGIRYRTGLAYDLHAGLALDATRLPYDDVAMGTAWLVGPQLTVDARRPLAGSFALVGGAAIGARIVTGLGDGNPLTVDGRAAGAFVLPSVRAEIGVARRLGPRLDLRVPLAAEWTVRRGPLAMDVPGLRGLSLGLLVDVTL